MLTVLLVTVGASSAHADYLATFTCTSGTYGGPCDVPAPTAPFVTFPSPTLTISFDGIISPGVSLPASDAPTDAYEWDFAVEPTPDPSEFITTYDIYDLNNESNTYYEFDRHLCQYCFDYVNDAGNLTFAYVPTPEPRSLALMLAGLGFLLVLKRKATARGHQQVT